MRMQHCICLLAATFLAGCSASPRQPGQRETLMLDVQMAIADFKRADPTLQSYFDRSAGYAVLPKVFKGAFLVGGAYGRGMVFERGGRFLGYCDMKQATLGFSFGGEYFREIIFFRSPQDLRIFTQGNFTLSAQATATAVSVGAAAKADYQDGMAVFVLADTGLMVDVSIGGQRFEFEPAPRLMN
ncbi:MAG: lipid-binding SYLF domain-containing protein [Anaerohalosphaeraceae bacterium]